MISLNFVFILDPPKPKHSHRGQSWLSPARHPLGIILPGSFSRPLWSPAGGSVKSELSVATSEPKSFKLQPEAGVPVLPRCLLHTCHNALLIPYPQTAEATPTDVLWTGECETQKPHRQWSVKNFSSWEVNSLLLLWTFPYRLQCMPLVYQDIVRDLMELIII